ncbi:DNA polymerase III subunit delta [Vibrio paucivorans]
MRIYSDRLPEQLKKGLHPLYLLFGNEPLLLQESRQAIQQSASQHGFDERHRFSVDSSLDWNEVHDCTQSLSLFSSRQLIELELPESGVNAAIGKELTALADALHPDVMLVLVGGKLTKAQENTKWFKSLSSNGCWVNCLTPDLQRLPQFVQARCRTLGLTGDRETFQMLAQWHEGNLMALSQSLEKLALLYPDGVLNLVRIEESLSRHNHFTAFHWVDALLAGKSNRSQRILRQLEAEGVEATILIRTIQKELLTLLKMKQELNVSAIGQVFDKHRVWQSKRPLYSSALSRLTNESISNLLQLLTQCEVLTKTQYDTSSWPILQQLSVQLTVPNVNIAALN